MDIINICTFIILFIGIFSILIGVILFFYYFIKEIKKFINNKENLNQEKEK